MCACIVTRSPPSCYLTSSSSLSALFLARCQQMIRSTLRLELLCYRSQTKYETSALPSSRLDEEWAMKLNAWPVIRTSYFACCLTVVGCSSPAVCWIHLPMSCYVPSFFLMAAPVSSFAAASESFFHGCLFSHCLDSRPILYHSQPCSTTVIVLLYH